jgi:2-polyprenyl-3-methyl-5-hydroxy-6-metoxy-1,4-benzoquinol methylase
MSHTDVKQSALGAHWNKVYRSRDETALTWFQEIPAVSMGFIGKYASPITPVIDVGGGASRLVDGLLTEGFADVTVLDLADEALHVAKARLGVRAAKVDWICADVTT